MSPRILIVEDEPLLGLDLRCIVEDAGFDAVGIATDMTSALEFAALGGIDLATMDVRLAGGSDGVETATRLWSDFGIRCLFVSGSIDDRLKARAAFARPIGYVSKPAEAQELTTLLRSHFAAVR